MAATETDHLTPDLDDATSRWEAFEAGLDELEADVPPDDDDFLSVDIPVKSGSVNLRALHPELHARLVRAFQDERVARIARVSSGVRTYEQQVYLFKKYGRGRAANPDYVRSDGRRGSAHMVQPSTFRYPGGFEPGAYGYAVDIGFWGAPQWKLLRAVMGEHGLRLTVFRPFEPWHFELDPDGSTARTGFGIRVTGSGVTDIQKLLAEQHEALPNTIPDPGPADGEIGPRTEVAIVAWQSLIGVDADGAWGPKTERASTAWLGRRTRTFRFGSSGDDVRGIQTYLSECHGRFPDSVPDPGAADGRFGRVTEQSVKGWQEVLELVPDGVWGPGTWKATDRHDDLRMAGEKSAEASE